MAAPIAQAWSGALRDGGPAELTVSVSSDEASSADLISDDLGVVLHHLSQLVTQVAIEARAGQLMMFHAAGLAHPVSGATVALVAPSGTGKTTISRSLGTALAYISDETVGFDASLSVLPYRKPLSVIQSGEAVKSQHSPGELGLLDSPSTPTLAAVVFLERDSTCAGLEVSDVRTVAALPLLAEQTSYLSRHARPLGLLADALEATGGLRLARYREAEDLQPWLTELVGASCE